MLRAIAHPTDFATDGAGAFAHALRLAVAYRCRLDLLHVHSPDDRGDGADFPHVRDILHRWHLPPAAAPVEAIESHLGVTVRKIAIRDQTAVDGVVHYLCDHRPDLLVVATHARQGLSRWLQGSISETVARATHLPTLFIGSAAHGFVAEETGVLRLDRTLMPVAVAPRPQRAYEQLARLLQPTATTIYPVHVGEGRPALHTADGRQVDIATTSGAVVPAILEVASRIGADLIAMPTAGHQGYLDALRGSTTEQVVRRAPCPVLALPA
ncbi:MAG: universal stress protein [Hyphomicrobiaceae bacterium]|nr:universal stress protein [Hyphomicrobiaceae bacterium]